MYRRNADHSWRDASVACRGHVAARVAGDQWLVRSVQLPFDVLGGQLAELGERGHAARLERVGILRPDSVEDRQIVACCDLGRLDGRDGRLDLGDGLFGHLVDLGGPTELGELGGDVDRDRRVDEHAHRGLTGRELGRDPLAVRGLEAEALVVEGAQQPAADHAGEQGRRGDDRQHEADPGTLADAALAELVGLDLALVVEGEDADRIELDVVVRLVPRLQRFDRIVGGRLVVEECQDHCLACHVQTLRFPARSPPTGTKRRTTSDTVPAVTRLVPGSSSCARTPFGPLVGGAWSPLASVRCDHSQRSCHRQGDEPSLHSGQIWWA